MVCDDLESGLWEYISVNAIASKMKHTLNNFEYLYNTDIETHTITVQWQC